MNEFTIVARRSGGNLVQLAYLPFYGVIRARGMGGDRWHADIKISAGVRLSGSTLTVGSEAFDIDRSYTGNQQLQLFVEALRRGAVVRGSLEAAPEAARALRTPLAPPSPSPVQRTVPPPSPSLRPTAATSSMAASQVWGALCAGAVVVAVFLPWYRASGPFGLSTSIVGSDISGLWGGWATGIAAVIGGLVLLADKAAGATLGSIAALACIGVALRNLIQYRDVARDILAGTGVDIQAGPGLYVTLIGAVALGISALVTGSQA
ncbi:hypothetical protein [Desertimonas flava]|uniref:hypothetical protein n=1 Tax=Desertimonas flava TaxID=2064846 RepID=UPI000E34490F|nr:hypothetical protein [Desertimonas flava]